MANTAARIDRVPARQETITIAELRHGIELAAVIAGRKSAPKPGGQAYERLARRALDSLLEAAWIHGQAVEWGIVVTRREVRRELTLIKQESFKSGAEYRRFLRESHYTRRDVYDRVEIQILSLQLQERLQALIEREARNPREEQRAFTEFIEEFNERWRARTVCVPAYATARCSNGAPPASL